MTSWTAPRTWTTSELVTASIMNTHVRDNLLYLKENVDPTPQCLNTDEVTRNNGGVAETDLSTYLLTAGKLATDGDKLRMVAWGICAAGASIKTLKAYFGATSVTAWTNNFNGATWKMMAEVVRTSATTQKMHVLAPVLDGASTHFMYQNYGTPGETLSGSITVKTTGQSNSASNEVTQYNFYVEYVPFGS